MYLLEKIVLHQADNDTITITFWKCSSFRMVVQHLNSACFQLFLSWIAFLTPLTSDGFFPSQVSTIQY